MVIRGHRPVFGCIEHGILPTPISFARPTPERTAWDAKTGPITQVFEWKVRTLCVGVSVELNLHPFRNKVDRVPHRLSEFPMAALLLSVAGAASSGGSPAQIGRLAWRQIDGLATNRARCRNLGPCVFSRGRAV